MLHPNTHDTAKSIFVTLNKYTEAKNLLLSWHGVQALSQVLIKQLAMLLV